MLFNALPAWDIAVTWLTARHKKENVCGLHYFTPHRALRIIRRTALINHASRDRSFPHSCGAHKQVHMDETRQHEDGGGAVIGVSQESVQAALVMPTLLRVLASNGDSSPGGWAERKEQLASMARHSADALLHALPLGELFPSSPRSSTFPGFVLWLGLARLSRGHGWCW